MCAAQGKVKLRAGSLGGWVDGQEGAVSRSVGSVRGRAGHRGWRRGEEETRARSSGQTGPGVGHSITFSASITTAIFNINNSKDDEINTNSTSSLFIILITISTPHASGSTLSSITTASTILRTMLNLCTLKRRQHNEWMPTRAEVLA
ncbi:unnamed protein product [Protopolystoma xenopodis]|uniref:Uncharacterized protein n=1 Tax=Protopolystoma xenopodis TaxID=117903 RepID=A0A3S5CT29_9PLAT|nr:unnamed protein product [Protopolystoma xenopodis]